MITLDFIYAAGVPLPSSVKDAAVAARAQALLGAKVG